MKKRFIIIGVVWLSVIAYFAQRSIVRDAERLAGCITVAGQKGINGGGDGGSATICGTGVAIGGAGGGRE